MRKDIPVREFYGFYARLCSADKIKFYDEGMWRRLIPLSQVALDVVCGRS
jgi:hypothetical protein